MRDQGETYCAEIDNEPHCVVAGCMERPCCELHDGCYAAGLKEFRGIHRAKVRTRRIGDERFYACATHLKTDPRMARFEWQCLLFPAGGVE
jgi:hypothetical protein